MRLSYLLILILFTGCSVFENEQSLPLDYTGEWQWVESTGGIIGMKIDADSVNYTQKLHIFEQNKAKWYLNGELLQEYRAQKLYEEADADFLLKPVIYDDQHPSMNKKLMGFKNGYLIIADECTDCFTYTFKR